MLPSRYRPPSLSTDDTASLETDTMRFLAILSICLMAVFALIESIPTTSADVPVVMETVENLELMAAKLEMRIAHLQSQANQLSSEIAKLSRRVEEDQIRLDFMSQQIRVAEQNLATQEERLKDLAPKIDAVDQAASESARKLSAIDRAVELAAQKLQEVKSKITPEESPAPSEQPAGALTLSFESDTALDNLVRQGQATLYARMSGKVWKSDSRWNFRISESPGQMYLVIGSVSKALQKAFKRSVLTSRSPEWYVTFDRSIAQDIEALMRRHPAGRLVVNADGSVLHEGP